MLEAPQDAARRFAAGALAQGYKPGGLFAYTDASGAPLFYRFRLKNADGDKWIRAMHLNGNGWEMKEPKFRDGKPLYRLHELAANPAASVWLVEGENKADALAKLGILTTTSGSASSAAGADWRPLQGRAVTVWPDNDAAGVRYAFEATARLHALGCAVRWVDVAALRLAAGADVIDWLCARPEATRADIEALALVEPVAEAAQARSARRTEAAAGLLRGSDVEPEAVTWLWKDWLAADVLHVLAGAPGTGKTTAALALAATITSGGRWPGGGQAEAGDVLIWSGEDVISKTLAPRLLAMGADMTRVHFIRTATDADGSRAFDPATDMDQLRTAIRQQGLNPVLLIVDPIVSAVAADSHKNGETRRALQPLVDLAEAEGCAVLGISHFSKGTAGRDVTERVTGSLAFGALARVVLATAKMPDDQGGGRLLARAKSNLGPDGGGYRYELSQQSVPGYPDLFASCLLWGEAVEGTAREILAQAETVDDGGARSERVEAADWLTDLLSTGRMKSQDVKRKAEQNGLAWRTVQRAGKESGLTIRREGFGPEAVYYWSLAPCAPRNRMRASPESVARMDELGAHGELEAGEL